MKAEPETTAYYGSLLNQIEFKTTPKVVPHRLIRDFSASLSKIDKWTLSGLPAISMQGTPLELGSPGSCEAQSFGYGLGSYTASRNYDGTTKWDPMLAENQVSAASLYKWALNKQSETCPDGTMAIPYLAHLVMHGSPNANEVPYYPVCCYLNSLSPTPNFSDMKRFNIVSYYSMVLDDDSAPYYAYYTFLLKLLLIAGYAIAFSGKVLDGYLPGTSIFENGIITSTNFIPKGGHGQLLVGFDDTVGPSDNPGAFLVQNSFGLNWPPVGSGSIAPPGMAYWSYDTFYATQSLAAIAIPCISSLPNGISLVDSDDQIWGVATIQQIAISDQSIMNSCAAVVDLSFVKPLLIVSITLTEPNTNFSMAGGFNAYMSNSHLCFVRNDGFSFCEGKWQLSLLVTDTMMTDPSPFSLTASVTLTAAEPEPLTASALTTSSDVYDTVGDLATLTIENSNPA